MMLKTRAKLFAVIALSVVAAIAFGATPAIAEGQPPRMEKVRISDDGRRFELTESSRPFVPWGFNYLGEFGQLMEDSWDKDWPRIERDFREMRKLGGNIVRIHLQFGTSMTGPDKFDRAQLGRLRKLLDLARETGLYLDITGLCCYRLDQIPKWYDELDEAKRWDVQARWWQMIAKTCAGHPAVFCYDLINEPIIGGPAKEGEPRWVGGELGGFYFVQRISEEAKGRTNLEIAAAWSKQLTEAIRREDSKTPITVGVIPWAQIWPKAKPVFYSPEASKHFDFVSIHVYPGKNKVAEAIAALAVYDIGKPLVVEETFPLECSIKEMDQFIDGGKEPRGGLDQPLLRTHDRRAREGCRTQGHGSRRALWRYGGGFPQVLARQGTDLYGNAGPEERSARGCSGSFVPEESDGACGSGQRGADSHPSCEARFPNLGLGATRV